MAPPSHIPSASSPADPETPILPAHIEQTIAAIGRLHERHQRRAGALQHAVESATAFMARPRFAGLLLVVLIAWVGANLALKASGRVPFDPPPFFALDSAAQCLAVFLTVFILSTQKRENELTDLRQQLTLELALISEQKSAKMIALLEELRFDMPSVPNRKDAEAEALSSPADPEAVLEALKESSMEHSEAPAAPA